MTRLPETHAPARAAPRGTMLLRAIAGLVVAALLLVVGLPREADLPAPSSRVAATFVHTAAVSQVVVSQVVVAKSGVVRSPLHTVAPNVAEAEDWAGRPALADPLSHRLPPLSDETGFRPRRPVPVRAWLSAPPDRPPRQA